MEGVGAYIFSVICGAAVCGIAMNFFPQKGAQAAAIKLIAGGFLAFTVISPFVHLQAGSLGILDGLYDAQASDAVEQGKEQTRKALADGIKTRCESYIKNKAEEMELSLSIEIRVSEDDLPIPISARISGAVSPYKKSKLMSVMADELGIPKEAQTWT